jgi:hypothetical protein
MIIVKRTDADRSWVCFHRSLGNQGLIKLDQTAEAETGSAVWNSTTPTSTYFAVNNDLDVNASGGTYVAYLFAHDAGGFGLTGTDNVITCGSFTTDGSGNATVSLGYEPQWVMFKYASGTADTGDWHMLDNMRGMPSYTSTTPSPPELAANLNSAEGPNYAVWPTATGFQSVGGSASTNYIYIAIRRGPMKVPTLGTSVFAPNTYTGTGAGTPPTITTNFPVDLTMFRDLRTGSVSAIASLNSVVFDRLRGNQNSLTTSSTAAEDATWGNAYLKFDSNTQMVLGTDTSYLNALGANYVNHSFRRAPGFFDVVCYTGTGAGTLVTHNLAVKPALIIYKSRSAVDNWPVNYTTNSSYYYYLFLNTTASSSPIGVDTDMTSTTITPFLDGSGVTYVAYLFATCAGVSKVGSYTGNGTTQTINCGFTGGARFVLIKRTDASGDWYVYDTARGMTTLTDPYLWLNSTAAEVATLGSVTTVSTGFALNSAILADINVSAGTYIFLAIA